MSLIARLVSLPALAVLLLAIAPQADDLDAFIKAQMSQREINGLSLAIIQDGRVDARAYGVTSRGGLPVTTATLFQAGSISKPVAALGALKLVEQGALSLDEDVNAKLKSWKVPDNEFTLTEKVTLRRILSHTAGLTVHGFPGYDVTERIPSPVQVLDGAGNTAPVRVDVVPGKTARYSGGGYTVMQLLVSDATGKPFAQYLNEAVLKPVGMSRSSYEQPLPPDLASQTAVGHYANRSAVSGRWHVYPEMAAAGLWTTATDLARFAIEVQQSLAGKSNKVVSQAMARQQLTEVKSSGYGLGLALSGSGAARTFGHNGRDAGFDARMLAYVETGQGVVVMINANDNSGMMSRIVEAVARKYNWPPRSSSPPAAATRIEPGIPLETVTGRYEFRNNEMLTLAVHNGTLFTDVDGRPDEEFLFMGDDRFGSSQRNASFRIARDAAGTVVGLTWLGEQRKGLIPRIGPLFASIKPVRDPNPSFTEAVAATVRALAQGGEAVRGLPHLSSGARTNLSVRPVREFAGMRSLTYVSAQDVTGRQIERHGGAVARVLFYVVETAQGTRRLLVHVTDDKLITDYDIVEK